MNTTFPLYLSTLPLLLAALWSFTLALPATALRVRPGEGQILNSFRLVILGHAVLSLSYFLSAYPALGLANASRVVLLGGGLASLLVMQGTLRLISSKPSPLEWITRFLLVVGTVLGVLFPGLFITRGIVNDIAGYVLVIEGDQEGAYGLLAGLMMLSVLIPTWAIWRQRQSWLNPYAKHLLIAIWATVLMGFVDEGLAAAGLYWPSTLWVGVIISNFMLLKILQRHYHEAFSRAEEAETAQDQLRERLTIEPMTGLYTRSYGLERLEGLLPHPGCSVMFIDLDDLKRWNDQHGHLMGDAAIQAAAQAIRGSVRRADIPVRYAGDEFLVILPDTQLADAQQVAQRILTSPALHVVKERRSP